MFSGVLYVKKPVAGSSLKIVLKTHPFTIGLLESWTLLVHFVLRQHAIPGTLKEVAVEVVSNVFVEELY